MTVTSIARIVVPSLLLVAACSAALVFGIVHARREPPVESKVVTPGPAVSPAPGDRNDGSATVAAAQAEANAVSTALAPNSPDAGDQSVPSFDVARIERTGDAVIAGRSAPGATVELLRNGEPHAHVVADQSGQFVMIPPRLPPGDYELTLRSKLPDGKEATSKQSVAIALQPSLKDQPVVALMTPGKASVVLSRPAAPNSGDNRIVVETVETEASGKLHVSGRSPPGTAVRLYLNNGYLGSTTAAVDGRFAFTVNSGIGPGNYRVRLDEVKSGGTVQSRAEVPFNVPATVASRSAPKADSESRAPSQEGVAREPHATDAIASADGSASVAVVPKVTTVVRGDSLWRISRNTYGNGLRYAVIYQANQNQIRNPNRIYPGQVFVLPPRAH